MSKLRSYQTIAVLFLANTSAFYYDAPLLKRRNVNKDWKQREKTKHKKKKNKSS